MKKDITKEQVEQVLKKARGYIAQPSQWTKGQIARDAKGTPTNPQSPDAICFCAIGALEKAVGNNVDLYDACWYAMWKCVPKPYASILAFNDNEATTHSMVLTFFNDAIVLTFFNDTINSLQTGHNHEQIW